MKALDELLQERSLREKLEKRRQRFMSGLESGEPLERLRLEYDTTSIFQDDVIPRLRRPSPVTAEDLSDTFRTLVVLSPDSFDVAYETFFAQVCLESPVRRRSAPIPTPTFMSPNMTFRDERYENCYLLEGSVEAFISGVLPTGPGILGDEDGCLDDPECVYVTLQGPFTSRALEEASGELKDAVTTLLRSEVILSDCLIDMGIAAQAALAARLLGDTDITEFDTPDCPVSDHAKAVVGRFKRAPRQPRTQDAGDRQKARRARHLAAACRQ